MHKVGHLHHSWLLLVTFQLAARNIGFEAFSEIGRAHDGIDDCDDNQDYGNDSECGERFAHRYIAFSSPCMLPHPDQLEKEVG